MNPHGARNVYADGSRLTIAKWLLVAVGVIAIGALIIYSKSQDAQLAEASRVEQAAKAAAAARESADQARVVEEARRDEDRRRALDAANRAAEELDARKRAADEMARTAAFESQRAMELARLEKIRDELAVSEAAHAALQEVLGKWTDAVNLASTTSRIALSGPMQSMQQLRRDTEAIAGLPPCFAAARDLLVQSEDYTIRFFTAFMTSAPGGDEYSKHASSNLELFRMKREECHRNALAAANDEG
jgi:hypothetical protein